MRLSQPEKLAEARHCFYNYQFRQAYNLYHHAFATLPFAANPAQLEHIGHYARTLLELNRLEELRFYLPILERHYEKSSGPLLGYALGAFEDGVGVLLRHIELWRDAPLWSPESIAKATEDWFKYLS